MDDLMHSLLVPHEGTLIPASQLSSFPPDTAMAAVQTSTVSSRDAIGPGQGMSIEEFEELYPIASTRRSSQYGAEFNNLCQKKRVVANFDYEEVSLQRFTGTLVLGGRRFTTPTSHPSKKLAKDALCEQALPFLQALEVNEPMRRASDIEAEPNDLTSENWVGLLNNYAQAKHHPRPPHYEEFQIANSNPPRFACTVTLSAQRPNAPPSFGSTANLFASKVNARRAAARDAILWLRSQDETLTNTSPLAPRTPTRPGPTTAIPHSQAEGSPNESTPDTDSSASSLPQQVQLLCLSLGFTPPAFISSPATPPANIATDQSVGAFVNLYAQFSEQDVRREPRLAGRIGAVERVYGKKMAKDICCREVLRVLEEIRRGTVGM